MKLLKIILIFVAIVIVLFGVLLFVAVQTIKPERIKTLAEDHISATLRRPTTIQHLNLGLSLKTGLNFEARGVDIQNLFAVETVRLKLDAKRFMTKKEIVIPTVLIDSPRIEWTPESIEGLPINKEGDEHAGPTTGKGESTHPETAEISEFQIGEIIIKNGQFHYREELEGRPVDVTVNRLNLTVRDFGLDRPFPYELNFGLMSGDKPLVDVKGKAVLLTKSQQLLVNDLDVAVLLRNLDLEEVRRNVPELSEAGLQRIDDGALHFKIPEIAIGEQGLKDLQLQGQLKKLTLQTDQIPVTVATDAQLTADHETVSLQDMRVQVGAGQIAGKADIRDYNGKQEFNAAVQLKGLSLGDLVDLSAMDMQVRADLNGTVDVTGAGFDQSALQNNLRGSSVLRLEDAMILDFNVLDYVLTQLPQVVKLGGLEKGLFSGLRTNLSQRHQELFERKDTVFEVADVRINIAAGRLALQETDFGAEGYFIRAAGDLGLDGRLDLRSEMFIQPELSQKLIGKVSELSALQDADGRIRIPFKRYRGPVTEFGRPELDIGDVFKQYYEARGREELKNVLRKALDLEEAPAPQVSGTQQLEGGAGQPSTPEQVEPEEILIDVLDGFLQKL